MKRIADIIERGHKLCKFFLYVGGFDSGAESKRSLREGEESSCNEKTIIISFFAGGPKGEGPF